MAERGELGAASRPTLESCPVDGGKRGTVPSEKGGHFLGALASDSARYSPHFHEPRLEDTKRVRTEMPGVCLALLASLAVQCRIQGCSGRLTLRKMSPHCWRAIIVAGPGRVEDLRRLRGAYGSGPTSDAARRRREPFNVDGPASSQVLNEVQVRGTGVLQNGGRSATGINAPVKEVIGSVAQVGYQDHK